MLALAFALRRPAVWAVFAGVATHLALDIGGELVVTPAADSSIWIAIFFPAFGWRFPKAPFHSIFEHLRLTAENIYVIAGEIVGGAILLRAWRLRRKSQSS